MDKIATIVNNSEHSSKPGNFCILSAQVVAKWQKALMTRWSHASAHDHTFQMTERSIIFVDSALLPVLFLPDISWD
jgi:hypothetical protein